MISTPANTSMCPGDVDLSALDGSDQEIFHGAVLLRHSRLSSELPPQTRLGHSQPLFQTPPSTIDPCSLQNSL